MNTKMQTLKAELKEAQRQVEATLATSPLDGTNPEGKTIQSLKLPRLNRERVLLQIKIEQAKEDNDPDWKIQELQIDLDNVQAQISAYKNNQTPSKRYLKK